MLWIINFKSDADVWCRQLISEGRTLVNLFQMQWDRFQNFQMVLCDLKKEIAWSQNYCSWTSLLLAIVWGSGIWNQTSPVLDQSTTSTLMLYQMELISVAAGMFIIIMHWMGMCFHTHMCYLHAVPGPSSCVHVPLWYTHVAMHVHYSLQEVNHTFLCSPTAWRGYHTHD